MPDLEGKSTAAARISLARIMTVVESNLLGTVHGGVIMKMVDDTAGAVAQRHAGGPAVTAAMDGMTFLEPVQVGDLVQAHAQVNWAGRTSMEVGVRVMAEPWNQAGQVAKRVATAYLVFVAVDADGQPRNIPPVLPETDEDRRRFRRPRSAARADWPAARPSWPAARSSPGHPPRRCYRPPGVIDPPVLSTPVLSTLGVNDLPRHRALADRAWPTIMMSCPTNRTKYRQIAGSTPIIGKWGTGGD